jgi:DNA excision repair protein ERCC-2
VADFATLLSTYFKGFTVIIEPYPEDNLIYDPLMQFYCLDASLATKPLF